jgi:hypothetical protein
VIDFWGPKQWVFARQNAFAHPQRTPGGQLSGIGQGPSTSWAKGPRGACEPCHDDGVAVVCLLYSLVLPTVAPYLGQPTTGGTGWQRTTDWKPI